MNRNLNRLRPRNFQSEEEEDSGEIKPDEISIEELMETSGGEDEAQMIAENIRERFNMIPSRERMQFQIPKE